MKNQREIILNVLNEYENKKDNLDNLLKSLKRLSNQEYGFIKTVTYGVVRYKFRLDYLIKKLSKIKFEKIEITVINILRLSLFQLIYMSHIPESAVVNEAVQLTKVYSNKGAVAFVNGSLRNFLRNKKRFLVIGEEELTTLSIEYSIPKWIIKEIKEAYKGKDLEAILEKFNAEEKFGIRITKNSESTVKSLLDQDYMLEKMKISKHGYILKNPEGIFNSDEYKRGLFYVQSESSQLVGHEISKLGFFNNVLDLCAAPGGKITHVANLQEEIGNFVACDINDKKLNLIKENINRLGLNNIQLIKNDATIFNEKFEEKFDLVIMDVPCSALGLMRKLPEVKYSKSKEMLKELNCIQEAIINNGSKYVIIGGFLVYSTCTFTISENEKIIANFINKNNNFELVYSRKISPIDFDSDGFCINILKRID